LSAAGRITDGSTSLRSTLRTTFLSACRIGTAQRSSSRILVAASGIARYLRAAATVRAKAT
jgi:hypothetical protein